MDEWQPSSASQSARAAAEAGRWEEARAAFAAAAAVDESADAVDGLGRACWWLGDVRSAIRHRERAFTLLRQAGRDDEATIAALDLCIWYLTNLENEAAAGGWLARAARAAEHTTDPMVRGWLVLIGAYLCSDATAQRAGLEEALRLAAEASDDGLHAMALADLGAAPRGRRRGGGRDGAPRRGDGDHPGWLRRPAGGRGLVELQHARRV